MKNKYLYLILIFMLVLTGCSNLNEPIEDAKEDPTELVSSGKISLGGHVLEPGYPDFVSNPDNFKQFQFAFEGSIIDIPGGDTSYVEVTHPLKTYDKMYVRYNKSEFTPVLFDNLKIDGYIQGKFKNGILIEATTIEKVDFEIQKEEFVTNKLEKEIEEEEPKEPVTLFSGTWTVGEDIIPGSYIVTCTGSGNITIKDSDDGLVTTEVLSEKEKEHYITRLKVDLEEGYTIEINGINEVYFK